MGNRPVLMGNRPVLICFKMNWIRSNESGLGFSSLVHHIFSLGQLIQFLCTPLEQNTMNLIFDHPFHDQDISIYTPLLYKDVIFCVFARRNQIRPKSIVPCTKRTRVKYKSQDNNCSNIIEKEKTVISQCPNNQED